jgi:GAF domain-containing protein
MDNVENIKIEMDVIIPIIELIKDENSFDNKLFFDKIFSLLYKIIQFDYCAIFLYDEEVNKIELVAQKGKAIDLIEQVSFTLGKGFSAWVAQEKRAVLLNDIQKSSTYKSQVFRSFLSIPLELGAELVGVINFGHKNPHSFSKEVIPQLSLISVLLASIISKTKHYQKISAKNRTILKINQELKDAQEKLIEMKLKNAISATAVSLNHEINNPLMIIEGNIHMLKEEYGKSDTKRFDIIIDQIHRISKIMKKLKQIEKPLLQDYVEGDSEQMLKLD